MDQKTTIFPNLVSKIFFVIFSLLAIPACNKKSEGTQKSGIYTIQNYTDLFLDESKINSYYEKFPESESIKKEVNQFYKNRDYQFAWFNEKGLTSAVSIFHSQIQNYNTDFENELYKNNRFDSLIDASEHIKITSTEKKNHRAELEISLTTTFFRYSKKAYGGIVSKPKSLDWYIPRKKKNYQALLNSLVNSDKGESILEPVNDYYKKLKKKLREYREISNKGGFPVIKLPKKYISVSHSDSCLLNLKHYLFLTKDLKENDKTIFFTNQLKAAIKNFQHRVGLVENGKLNTQTLNELNKPIDFRIKQMMLNLERLRWVPVEMEKKFLLVNIPEYKLHVVENTKLMFSTNVVVGKDAKQTSVFKGNISSIILNPYWNIPKSIVINEIVPNIKKNSDYIARNNMEVLSGSKLIKPSSINWQKYKKDIPYTIRQKPGESNSLGKIKFMFPNNFNIYLHDTPSKAVFNKSNRAFSHGCIRVENPKKLLLYLVQNDLFWNSNKVDSIFKTNKQYVIKIKPSIPVYIVYFTSWVDNEGQLNFRNDVYNLDKQLANEIFGD